MVIVGAGVGASVDIRAASCCCRTGPCCCHTGPWFSILLSHLGLVLADIVVVAGPPARVQQTGAGAGAGAAMKTGSHCPVVSNLCSDSDPSNIGVQTYPHVSSTRTTGICRDYTTEKNKGLAKKLARCLISLTNISSIKL